MSCCKWRAEKRETQSVVFPWKTNKAKHSWSQNTCDCQQTRDCAACKPQGSLPPWGDEATSSFCSWTGARSGSTGKEGEVWCSLKGRLPPEENPQGLDSGKGRESEENIKRNFVLFVHDTHIHVPQADWRKEWVFFKKKKNPTCSFPQSSVTLWWLEGGEGCSSAKLNFAQRVCICYQPTAAEEWHPGRWMQQVTFTPPWSSSLTWSD